jgi:carboxymethylenebutenolidase
MNMHTTLTASDTHSLGAYRADPAGKPKGGVVVVQEIFGVNSHIRAVCDRVAALGYSAIAPALFDRQSPGFESGYSPEEIEKARAFLKDIDWDAMLRDIGAAADALRPTGPVAVVGFCLGGSLAFLSATRLAGLSASVCFYGGQIAKFADEVPKCPTQMHFGEKDQSIPMSDVDIVKSKRSDCEIYTYPAGHGFNCDERGSYEPESAKLAWSRMTEFLERHMRA